MSEMVKRYEESKQPRPEQSHKIPELAVDMFDTLDQFQDGFTVNEKPNDPTKFTDTAQKYYDTELKNIVANASFQPTEQGIPLMRWTPKTPYYNPGSPNT